MGGLVDAVFGGGADAPDYTPVAAASEEAARIGAELGGRQLDEATRQYEINRAVAQPVVDAQLALMDQAKQQGDEYYNYLKTFRPLEQQLSAEATQGTFGQNEAERALITNLGAGQANDLASDARGFQDLAKNGIAAILAEQGGEAGRAKVSANEFVGNQTSLADQLMGKQSTNAATLASRGINFEGDQTGRINNLTATGLTNSGELRNRTYANDAEMKADIALATGGNSGIASRFRDDINNDVGTAVADARVGQTRALDTAARTAMRYGISVPLATGQVSLANASQLAGAANTTRNNSLDKYRSLITQGIGLKSNNFAQNQGALTEAINKEEGALAGDLSNRSANFQQAQGNLDSALTRDEGAVAGRLNNNQNIFITGEAAKGDASNRNMNAVTTAYNFGRDAFTTGNAAKTDAYNRSLNAANSNRNMRLQDQNIDFARKLDVAGIARGLPGASTGAYGVSVNAGNSANSNNAAPGNSYLSAIQGGIGTIQQVQQSKLSGLTNILGNQNQAYLTTRGQNLEVIGTGVGAGVAAFSDERLKLDIELVGQDSETGLNLYEFAYAGEPDRRFVGVMAQEVQKLYPQAVSVSDLGYLQVHYSMLGIELKEVA